MWFMERPSQFSVGQTAQSLTCSIMEKPHAGLDDCLRMLQSCFRKRMSAVDGQRHGNALINPLWWNQTDKKYVKSSS